MLQAIRETDFRAQAIGYRVVVFRNLRNLPAALFACVVGALPALCRRLAGAVVGLRRARPWLEL